MTERPRRFVLLVAALALTASILLKGRDIPGKGDAAAFLPDGAESIGTLTIGVRGNAAKSGIYQVHNQADLDTVINMTVPAGALKILDGRSFTEQLRSGDIVVATVRNGDLVEITIEKMTASEKLLLGIPLDPNNLSEADWENLPVIGKVTAHSIITDRQINGDFSSIKDLKRVPGIGDVRLKQLERYFVRGLSP